MRRLAIHRALSSAIVAAAIISMVVGPGQSTAAAKGAECRLSSGRTVGCPLLVPGNPPSLTIRSYRGSRVSADGILSPPPNRTLQLTQFTLVGKRRLAMLEDLLNHLGSGPVGHPLGESRIPVRRVDVLQFHYPNGDRWTVTVSWIPSPHAFSNSGEGIPQGSPYNSRHDAFAYLRSLLP